MPEEMQAWCQRVKGDTRGWVERAVIGLNLCPFARAVHMKGQIHYAVSKASAPQGLLADLKRELDELMGLDPVQRETTLLIAPLCLQNFLEFNGFVGRADRMIARSGLAGEVQLASFHPDYQFADAEPADIANFTNRSPYPVLQLLREASIERAALTDAQAQAIYEANMGTLQRLGPEGWAALGVGPS